MLFQDEYLDYLINFILYIAITKFMRLFRLVTKSSWRKL